MQFKRNLAEFKSCKPKKNKRKKERAREKYREKERKEIMKRE